MNTTIVTEEYKLILTVEAVLIYDLEDNFIVKFPPDISLEPKDIKLYLDLYMYGRLSGYNEGIDFGYDLGVKIGRGTKNRAETFCRENHSCHP